MRLSVGAAAVGLLAVTSMMHGAEAVNCTFANGQCTAVPCPTSTLDVWSQCILANVTAGACPEGCKLLPNTDGTMPPGICVLPAASATGLTTAEINQIRACTAAPDRECVIPGLALLDQTGCTGCVNDLLETEARLQTCAAVVGGQAACEAVNTPCDGEPPPEVATAPGPAALAPIPGEAPMPLEDFLPAAAPLGEETLPPAGAVPPTALGTDTAPDAAGQGDGSSAHALTGAAAVVFGVVVAITAL